LQAPCLIDRDLVDDVLAETGRVEQRSRLLPARVVVYYVLALCLFFGDAAATPAAAAAPTRPGRTAPTTSGPARKTARPPPAS
jgi:hypothetical protein